MKLDFDKLGIAKVYTRVRLLPKEGLEVWRREIVKLIDKTKVRTVLDLGCGTGLFTKFLKKTFQARVIGVDPSKEMLQRAQSLKLQGARFVLGKAEKIPLKAESVDLVFMSMVYHVLNSEPKAAAEIKRVLKKNGYLVVVQHTKENNPESLALKFFPEIARLTKKIVPTRSRLKQNFLSKGFRLQGAKTMKYVFARNYKSYYDYLRLRGISVLRVIPDRVFRKKLKMAKKYCFDSRRRGPVYERRDLFVFEKLS